ncbi:MFS transporter [Cytobacillus spongiae]|uniref:MFS transporter n=1 Tax=Cytobacillus spongiae TaxID=2901381 RepID=UPI001F322B0F|nr:MFS transporter [Cytobacillus spongiae]UII56839.1 MFS transporter [Cytobacillus spongiae]
MNKFKEIFKNPNFVKLFFANFTSQMGSTIGLTAFMFYLLERFSDQPVYASITELMYSLPTLFIFFLVGVFADRMDRQKIALYCDWIGAALSVLLLLAIMTESMPLIFSMLFLRSAVQKFFYPAESAIIQGILKKDDYTAAAGINQLVMSLFMLFGNGLGILAFWTVGVYGAIIVDTITFIISALLIRSCDITEEVRLPNGRHTLKDLKVGLVLNDFKVGMLYIVKHKLLRALLMGFFIFGVVNGGFTVMPVFILKYKLAPTSYEEMSIYIGIIFGIGVLLGSFLASLISQKMKLYQMVIIGVIVSGGFIILSSLTNDVVVYLVLTFLSALALPLINIGIGGWLPSIIDPKMMGRVQGWVSPLMMLSQSVTLGLIAFSFPAYLSVEMLYWLVGGCMVFTGILYMITLPKYSKNTSVQENVASVRQTGTV